MEEGAPMPEWSQGKEAAKDLLPVPPTGWNHVEKGRFRTLGDSSLELEATCTNQDRVWRMDLEGGGKQDHQHA